MSYLTIWREDKFSNFNDVFAKNQWFFTENFTFRILSKIGFVKTPHINFFSGPDLEKILKSWVSKTAHINLFSGSDLEKIFKSRVLKNCSYHPVAHLRAEKSCPCHRKNFIHFILRPSLETSSETLPESREELFFFYQDMGILPAKISGYCHEHSRENVIVK